MNQATTHFLVHGQMSGHWPNQVCLAVVVYQNRSKHPCLIILAGSVLQNQLHLQHNIGHTPSVLYSYPFPTIYGHPTPATSYTQGALDALPPVLSVRFCFAGGLCLWFRPFSNARCAISFEVERSVLWQVKCCACVKPVPNTQECSYEVCRGGMGTVNETSYCCRC